MSVKALIRQSFMDVRNVILTSWYQC